MTDKPTNPIEPLFATEPGDTLAHAPPPIVESSSMRSLYELAARAAASPVNVLIHGEAGVGKTTLARWLHAHSLRKAGPLVTINCATPELRLEKAMFGSARTMTHEAQPGAFEVASGGTSIIEDVGALHMGAQAKLLRVITNWEVWRANEGQGRRVDVRHIATSADDLMARTDVLTFRLDLLHRLSGYTFRIPPLRERREEIEPLARHFLAIATTGGPAPKLSGAILDLFHSIVWLRNLDQLREVVTKAVERCAGPEITPKHVDVEALTSERLPGTTDDRIPVDDGNGPADLTDAERAERARIIEALADGNATRLAIRLGMARRTLISKLDRYKIPRPRPPDVPKE